MKAVILKSRISHLGGLERYAIAIAKKFALKKIQTTLLTTGDEIDIPNVNVISLGKHPKFTSKSIAFFNKATEKWLKTFPQDIIFGLDRNAYQTHFRAGNGLHKTFLKHKFNNSFLRCLSLLKPKERIILKQEKKLFENRGLKTLFTNSNMVKNELIHTYDIDPEKICTVHNGVNFEKFNFDSSSRENSLHNLKLDTNQNYLLFVGNNYKRKNLELVLKALFKCALKKYHLLVVGSDKNIPKYKSLCHKLKLSHRVHFYGSQSNLLPFYQASDCLILPSYYDPFANVTIEALAMGLFVITSQNNGGSEVLMPYTGYILNQLNESQELVDAINSLNNTHFNYETKKKIRNSILRLDINTQLDKIVAQTLISTT